MHLFALPRLFLFISIGLFLACLPFDSFCRQPDHCEGEWPSWAALIFGPILVIESMGNLSWVANPLLAYSWSMNFGLNMEDQEWSEKAQSLAFAIASLTFASFLPLNGEVVSDTSGSPRSVYSYGTGYWLWISSMLVACLSSLILIIQHNTPSARKKG